MNISITVRPDDFDLAAEYAAIGQMAANIGAVVSFTGHVRAQDRSVPLQHLFLEHCPGVTEAEIERIVQAACRRWPVQACRVWHRVGLLGAGAQIVLVLVAAEHRQAAFACAEYVMDYLKTEAPFWKQAHWADGQTAWVAAKASDEHARARWVQDGGADR